MSVKPISLLGGESVYCINEDQLRSAHHMAFENPETAPKIQAAVRQLEKDMTRNERAAVAFLVIDRLLKSTDKTPL